jgi:SpoVK/Ycf46/Vps4 family AAA+-type ATPase
MSFLNKTKDEWFEIGGEHINNEDFDKAITAYLKALKIDDSDSAVWFNLGLSYHALDMFDEAYDSFNQAITLSPEDAEAYLQKGCVLYNQEKYRLAIKNINKALELGLESDDEVTAFVTIAESFISLEKLDDALPYCESALELDDENVEALSWKALILYSNGDVDEANELIEEAKEIDPGSPYIAGVIEAIESISNDDEDVNDDDEDQIENADTEQEIPTNKNKIKSKQSEEKNSPKSKKSFKRPESKKNDSEPKGFACVAGMRELKDILEKDVIQPLKNPEKFKKFNVSTPNGILLFGPPGCGKTFIVRKLAEEIDYNFQEFSPSSIGSTYQHGTTGKIAEIFQNAKNNAPTILFFDEIEALVPKRESLGESSSYRQEEINEFLSKLNDASQQGILVVGATNQPDLIDSAIMRSGRMDKRIYIGPPDTEARIELFRTKLTKSAHSKDLNFEKLAEMTNYYSSSDISMIVEEAGRKAAHDDLDEIEQELLEFIIENAKPSITKSQIEGYTAFSHLERK